MLDIALDYEITEKDFWEMTIKELERAIQSKIRRKRIEARERATYDYILAGLISHGVANAMGSKTAYPTLEEAYPGIFDEVAEERKAQIEEQKMNLSALRFKQFAQSYNDNLKNKEVPKKINE